MKTKLIAVGVVLSMACAPVAPAAGEVLDSDGGVGLENECEMREGITEDELNACQDKFIPALFLAFTAARLIYVAASVARVAMTVRAVTTAGTAVNIKLSADALANVRRGVSIINALQNSGLSRAEATRVQALAQENAAPAIPASVTRTCNDPTDRKLNNYHAADACDASRPGRNDCVGLIRYIKAQKTCATRRKDHATACYPNGGLGPMGAGDAGHNQAYCHALRQAASYRQMAISARCGGVPSVTIPAGC